MTQIHWLNPVSGSFAAATDWSGGVVPGASDDALLNAAGSAFTVTSSTSEAVHSVQLAANGKLSITGGTFTATAGTGGGANAGNITVGDQATLAVGGLLNNTGAIRLDSISASVPTSLILASNTTLSGGGAVILTGPKFGESNDEINAAAGATVTLDNVDDVISGFGYINGGPATPLVGVMNIVNQAGGVIEAVRP